MQIKALLKHHYQEMYHDIKHLDQETKDRSSESVIRRLNNNTDQLSSFINLLAHVDETIPLVRCQSALGRFKKDFFDLHLNYLEERLVAENPLLFDEHGKIKNMLAHEESISKQHYLQSVHQLYINTIHATENLVEQHIDQLNEEGLRSKVYEYFKNAINVYLEHLARSDFDTLDIALTDIYYNLLIFQQIKPQEISDSSTDDGGKELLNLMFHLRKILETRKLYYDTVKKLQFYGCTEDQLDKDLIAKMQVTEKQLLNAENEFGTFGDQLLKFLNRVLWIDSLQMN
jgi:hypothetical protein